MNNDTPTLRAFGLLLILAIASGILNSVPAIEKADYLVQLPSLAPRIHLAVVFQALMAVIYMAITAISYPLIARTGRKSAIAYLGFRVTAAGFLFVGIVSLLMLLALGRAYADGSMAGRAELEVFGALFRQGRDWLNHICVILPWSIGSLLLYRSFYRSALVPRWMSVWGFLASLLTLAATALYMLGVIPIVSVSYFALNVPTAILEIILGIYLLVRRGSGEQV